ncbi:hypothetical protein MIR68_005563 [Amoeboaphelidium protococcarum]|nr:hypothetical protein MIR68_005563 [Amoeboaphelidium protococcarum]
MTCSIEEQQISLIAQMGNVQKAFLITKFSRLGNFVELLKQLFAVQDYDVCLVIEVMLASNQSSFIVLNGDDYRRMMKLAYDDLVQVIRVHNLTACMNPKFTQMKSVKFEEKLIDVDVDELPVIKSPVDITESHYLIPKPPSIKHDHQHYQLLPDDDVAVESEIASSAAATEQLVTIGDINDDEDDCKSVVINEHFADSTSAVDQMIALRCAQQKLHESILAQCEQKVSQIASRLQILELQSVARSLKHVELPIENRSMINECAVGNVADFADVHEQAVDEEVDDCKTLVCDNPTPYYPTFIVLLNNLTKCPVSHTLSVRMPVDSDYPPSPTSTLSNTEHDFDMISEAEYQDAVAA